MGSSRSLLKPLPICIAVVALIASVLGFRDQLPPAVRDFGPSASETTALLKKHGSGVIDRVKDVAPESKETYWPGLPVSRREKLISLTRIGYSVGYSTTVYSPLWAAYSIKSVKNPESSKRPDSFEPDPDLPERHQVTHSEYTRSGYDRGHLAPNCAVSISYGRKAQMETFLMTNITPQEPSLNQGIWQVLESIEANDYARRYNGVVSYCGPIYSSEPKEGIGKGKRIRIPSAFYKIIVRRQNEQVGVLAFVIPQTARGNGKSLPKYLASVDSIEGATGLDFLTALPEGQQTVLEATAAKRLW